MACEHKRIKSVNCVLFCDICGEKLPADFLTGKQSPATEQAAETGEKPQETPKKRTTRKKG